MGEMIFGAFAVLAVLAAVVVVRVVVTSGCGVSTRGHDHEDEVQRWKTG